MIDDQTFLEMYSAAKNYSEQLTEDNVKNLNYYLRNKRGDEKPNESQAVSSDCFDVVESDMPSMVRTFLGGGDVMEFQAGNPDNPAEVLEAAQKTKLVNRLVLGQDNSYKTLYDWIKGAEIFNASPITYYPRETEKREIKVYEGVSEIEVQGIVQALDENDTIESAEIKRLSEADSETATFDIEVTIMRKATDYVIEFIQPDKFLISRGGPTIDDCSFVGHVDKMRKGELIEMGIKKSVVESLTGFSGTSYADQRQSSSDTDRISDIMQDAIGGDYDEEQAPEWYLEEVEVVWACVIGADKRGRMDRRRILYADNTILQDEPFDHVNYAILTSYPLPGQAVGLSRVGITRPSQDQKTFAQRGMFNNMAAVNKPMTAINIDKESGAVNQDDIRNRRVNGIVRVNGDPSRSVLPLLTPDIGPSVLQMIQYIDFTRAQTTGALMASQGLNKDDIYSETATRFKGVNDEGAAKVENVMRIYAETGWRKLYRGVEWMVKHYQSDQIEERILGEQIAYSPEQWAYDSNLSTTVGLAASDTSELIENLGAIYNTQMMLKQQGSVLVDDQKLYNSLKRLLKAMNVHDNQSFYNDPSVPDQTLKAQNEQMQGLIAQMQQQLQASSIVDATKQIEDLKSQVDMLKEQNKASIEGAKLTEEARQFDIKTAQDAAKRRSDNAIKITELELQNKTNLPGGL